MAIAQRLILIIFCIGFSYSQRIPVALFEPVVITSEQQSRIDALDSLAGKSVEQQHELAMLYASTRAFEQSFDILSSLAEEDPENYDYQFMLGGIAGTLASEVSQVKSFALCKGHENGF
jgi:Tfp pilus assembly protein PilN